LFFEILIYLRLKERKFSMKLNEQGANLKKTLYSRNLQMGKLSYTVFHSHSSLLGSFVTCKENEVL
jgi:hypothetical protein